MRFSDWPMRLKLGAAFAAVLVIIGGVAVFAMASLADMKTRNDVVIGQDVARAMWAKDVIANTLDIAYRARVAASSTDDGAIAAEIAEIEKLRAANGQRLKRLEGAIVNEQGRVHLARAVEARQRVSQTYDTLYERLRSKDVNASLDFVKQTFAPASVELMAAARAIGSFQDERMRAAVSLNNEEQARARVWVISTLVLAVLLSVALILMLNHLIQKPLAVARGCALRMAEGDLSMTWEGVAVPHDELGQTLSALRRTQESLGRMLAQIAQSAGEVGRAAGNVATSAREVSEASAVQSESSASSAAAMEQLTVSIDQVAENASEASAKADESDRLGAAGGDAVSAAGHSSRDIATRIETTAERLSSLSGDLQRIGSVTSVIQEVADQTNLLALNAAIEAARAGEQGRGFAVVADEVRKLAERASSSAAEIARMVQSVEAGAAEVVAAMQDSRDAVAGVLESAETATRSVSQSRHGAQETQQAVQSIRDTLAEQRGASTQIARHIEAIAQAAEENSSAARSANEESQRLLEEAERLKAAVNTFRLAA